MTSSFTGEDASHPKEDDDVPDLIVSSDDEEHVPRVANPISRKTKSVLRPKRIPVPVLPSSLPVAEVPLLRKDTASLEPLPDSTRLANMDQSLNLVTEKLKEMRGELDSQRNTIFSQEKKMNDQQRRLGEVEEKLVLETEQVKKKAALILEQTNIIKKEKAGKAELEKRLSGALEAIKKQKGKTSRLQEDFEMVNQTVLDVQEELDNKKQQLAEVTRSLNEKNELLDQQTKEIDSLKKRLDSLGKFAFLVTPDPTHFTEASGEVLLELQEAARDALTNIVATMHILASGYAEWEKKRPPPESEELLCVVCLNNKKSIILRPCNHLCLCEECSASKEHSIKECPVCRKKIEKRERVFLA